ncbi:hypothetical protein LX32DRAFT_633299 [Colletotrichum zoysiae]|uniref:Cell wall protein n=1 Tax=Colletotrichum zoysiae TaxID=1216348 RepID=A0AAD9M6R6_9PEZI|nr:hypothetical protein LX32DRAFT_633299 [Colletotrichum zoysiae]
MRFSPVLIGLVATACITTVMAAPMKLPVGLLPSQPTTSNFVIEDLTAIKTVILAFNAAVQKVKKSGASTPNVYDVQAAAIEIQGVTKTARLDAKDILDPFNHDESTPISDELQEVLVALQATADLLDGANTNKLLGDYGGVVTAAYLALAKDQTGAFTHDLLPNLDASIQPDARAKADSINDFLNEILKSLTSKKRAPR